MVYDSGDEFVLSSTSNLCDLSDNHPFCKSVFNKLNLLLLAQHPRTHFCDQFVIIQQPSFQLTVEFLFLTWCEHLHITSSFFYKDQYSLHKFQSETFYCLFKRSIIAQFKTNHKTFIHINGSYNRTCSSSDTSPENREDLLSGGDIRNHPIECNGSVKTSRICCLYSAMLWPFLKSFDREVDNM